MVIKINQAHPMVDSWSHNFPFKQYSAKKENPKQSIFDKKLINK